MIKKTVLPADIYLVFNKTILHEEDRIILSMLYQPIIGGLAINLYHTLWACLDRGINLSEEFTHHHLMTFMQVPLETIITAREKLEAIGLLKTYFKLGECNHYFYQLYSPLSPSDFINHPVLSTTLLKNLGKRDYDKTVSYFKLPRIQYSDYEDISCQFHEVFRSSNETFDDVYVDHLQKVNRNYLSILSELDVNGMLELIPDAVLHHNSITKETKELIHKLAFIYDLKQDVMSDLIYHSINEKQMIDKDILRKQCRHYYQFEHNGKLPGLLFKNQPESLCKPVSDTSKRSKMIYQFETTSPYYFLKSKLKGGNPSKTDLAILEYLLIDLKLMPGVVNVLIDYVLKTSNNKLIRGYIETIAGQWKRSDIKTVEEAMLLAESEHKKTKKKSVVKKQSVPDWYGKEVTSERASAEEIAELDRLLSKVGEK